MSELEADSNPQYVDAQTDVEALIDPTTVPLVVFDFDGTLAAQRGSWGLLYRLFGVEDRGEERTKAYWNDELTFQEWCDGNVADWREKGVTQDNLERAAGALKLTVGADALLSSLNDSDVPFGVLSSGIVDLVHRLDPYDPDFVESNVIYYDEGIPIGVDARVGPFAKGEALRGICERRGVTLGDVVYVGDSHSDTEAFAEAGLSVLFDPDDRIDDEDYELVDVVVAEHDLVLVAALLGIRED